MTTHGKSVPIPTLLAIVPYASGPSRLVVPALLTIDNVEHAFTLFATPELYQCPDDALIHPLLHNHTFADPFIVAEAVRAPTTIYMDASVFAHTDYIRPEAADIERYHTVMDPLDLLKMASPIVKFNSRLIRRARHFTGMPRYARNQRLHH